MPIVDFHVHTAAIEDGRPGYVAHVAANRGGDFAQFVREFSDPQRFVRYLDENGVDYAVVLAALTPVPAGVVRNEYVAEFCRASPRLIPFASINPYLTPEPARELERLVRELGFRGLKLYPTYGYYYPNDPMLYPVYARAQALGIPVMCHTGSSVFPGARLKYGDPLYLDDVAVDFPDLVLFITHGGRPFWYDRAYALARLHPSVYIDIAGLPPHKLLDYFPELPRIAHKVVFGTDWPGIPGTIADNIAAIRRLPLDDAAKEAILGGTAARLLGLPERRGEE
jgi:predicted TIM-barrel fold metal-dependent hydrolase